VAWDGRESKQPSLILLPNCLPTTMVAPQLAVGSSPILQNHDQLYRLQQGLALLKATTKISGSKLLEPRIVAHQSNGSAHALRRTVRTSASECCDKIHFLERVATSKTPKLVLSACAMASAAICKH
jgi:hypothetical protein